MLTNHTFVLTTPSWNIKLLDRYYQIYAGLSTKFDVFYKAILQSKAKRDPAYYPDKFPPGFAAGTPDGSCSGGEIPESGRCQVRGPRF